MRAEILSIGTELLLGDIVNTNAQYLSRRLAELGVYVYFQTVVGDNPERILEAYANAYGRADLVVISGGLGPTEDDLTKEMAASYFGLTLVDHPEIWEPIRLYYEKRGAKPIESARKQAAFPEGAVILPNSAGTAPGCWIEAQGCYMAMMPGPPREMIPMFEEQVIPRLKPHLSQTFQSRLLRVCGAGESNVEEMLKDLITGQANPTIATYAKEGEVHVRITARAETEETAEKLLSPVAEACREALGELVYGQGDASLEETIFLILRQRNLTMAVAESLTGGLLTGRLVNVPGMSACLLEGLIPYTNQAKIRQLGIEPDKLEAFGPVSSEIAEEMARRVAQISGADIGLAVTGWAGPSQDPSEPVGLIWMGLHLGGETLTQRISFGGDRNRIRFFAANMALCWLLRELKKAD
ncbi:competence/damage-inducible protein A [Anoxynatronum buryatiense]|uniref:Putative competence-damage inducible protein n=1 Tax=Anoxynatronum buryatiense TaxID=489973 RepID=A0AA45WTG2_9CLOT|nr:competence/damage-inducible protein A [Anoxynatronum buryatiense]SMP42800.1 competence/damage-inducible protein cinA [Anoxynatronum buryatiense]